MSYEEFKELQKLTEKEFKEKFITKFKAGYYTYYKGGIVKILAIFKNARNKTVVIFEELGGKRVKSFTLCDESDRNSIVPNRRNREIELKEFEDFKRQSIINKCPESLYKKLAIDSFTSVFETTSINDEDGVLYLTAYLPKVTITNSVGSTHDMLDVYLRFGFWNNKLYSVEIARGTLTLSEIRSVNSYIFSHVSSHESYACKWYDSFCYGNNTPLSKLVGSFKMGNTVEFTELFILFNEYLKWESLEGKPYRYINDVQKVVLGKTVNMYSSTIMSLPQVKNVYLPAIADIIPNLSYTITDLGKNKFSTKLTPESINLIDTTLSSIGTDLYHTDGQYSYENVDMEDILKRYNNNRVKSQVIFNGETVKGKVVAGELSNTSTPKIHRAILNRIVSEVETALTDSFNQFKLNQLL
ncbi:MAG: hypothetical protein ACRCXT_22100 [Paraclostridium sp.]